MFNIYVYIYIYIYIYSSTRFQQPAFTTAAFIKDRAKTSMLLINPVLFSPRFQNQTRGCGLLEVAEHAGHEERP